MYDTEMGTNCGYEQTGMDKEKILTQDHLSSILTEFPVDYRSHKRVYLCDDHSDTLFGHAIHDDHKPSEKFVKWTIALICIYKIL